MNLKSEQERQSFFGRVASFVLFRSAPSSSTVRSKPSRKSAAPIFSKVADIECFGRAIRDASERDARTHAQVHSSQTFTRSIIMIRPVQSKLFLFGVAGALSLATAAQAQPVREATHAHATRPVASHSFGTVRAGVVAPVVGAPVVASVPLVAPAPVVMPVEPVVVTPAPVVVAQPLVVTPVVPTVVIATPVVVAPAPVVVTPAPVMVPLVQTVVTPAPVVVAAAPGVYAPAAVVVRRRHW